MSKIKKRNGNQKQKNKMTPRERYRKEIQVMEKRVTPGACPKDISAGEDVTIAVVKPEGEEKMPRVVLLLEAKGERVWIARFASMERCPGVVALLGPSHSLKISTLEREGFKGLTKEEKLLRRIILKALPNQYCFDRESLSRLKTKAA